MLSAWDDHAHWTIGIRASHGLSAAQSIQSNGCSSSSATQGSGFQLFGSVLGACLCTAHYARIAARYRDQFASATQTFLSHGVALQNGFSQYLGQRKPSQAVGSLCGLGPSLDQNGAYALRQRTVELGVGVADGCDRLRVGFDYDRLVFEHLQLGTVSNYEGSDQASYPDRFEGIDPEFYSYQRWKNARCKSARYPLRARLYRGWRVLRDGQSVCRLRATLHIAHGQSVLRDSCQDKHASRDGAIVSRRDKYWFDQRSSCSIGWGADRCAVSRANSTCNVLRPRNRQYLRVSDKQSHPPASQHYLRNLQTALASRIVLLMDQTAPSNQSLLWQHGKCREDANMDRDCDLRLDCNYEEAIEFETFALRNPKSIGLKHV